MRNKERLAIKKSIAHWKRMIEFVEKTGTFERYEMKNILKETYDGNSCELCSINTKIITTRCSIWL